MMPMTMSAVLTRVGADGVATMTFNRPKVHNAIDETVIAEFKAGLRHIAADSGIRVLVVAGEGESFCAGADLNWMKRTASYSEEQNYREAADFAELLHLLRDMPKPTIAKVHGPAYGGGVGIVVACDIAIGAPSAIFSFSEVRLGLIPAMISPYAIAAIGERYARRYMLSAERIEAAEALRIGLLHELCDQAELDQRVQRAVANLLRGGPASIAACKTLISRVASGSIDSDLRDHTARAIAAIRASAEGKEGVSAFLEKRAPAWAPANTKGKNT
jgi:methylglutaconyl-CoA hydratase